VAAAVVAVCGGLVAYFYRQWEKSQHSLDGLKADYEALRVENSQLRHALILRYL